MSSATFEEVVRAWLLSYDDRLPNNRIERREAFIVLLHNLQNYGYGKEDLNTSKKEKIVRYCVNLNHKNKKKLSSWINLTVDDLEVAILEFYKTVTIEKDGVITSEMRQKLEDIEQRALETKAIKSPDSDSDESDEHEENLPLTEQVSSLEIREAIENPKNKKTALNQKKEIFEITPDTFPDDVGPNVTWDEDFYKRLEQDNE